jgi:predicted nucleic acid-binding protein
MLLLISDANLLIDMEDGNLTPVIFQLPYEIAVPDILFELELRERHIHLLKAGLKVKSLTAESVKKTEFLTQQYPRPSMMDHSALALALQERCPLLTGDKDLRIAAKKEGVEVHGTIWIIEELLNQKIIQQPQAKGSFDAMRVKGSRLPWGDVDKLLNRWELIGANNE